MPRTIQEFKASISKPEKIEADQVRIAFIGDPNVGKSTIINRVTGMQMRLLEELLSLL